MLLDIIFFIIKYIPWWAIPCGLISASFAYVYWIKDVRDIALSFFAFGCFCFVCLCYWVLTGGPNESVKFLLPYIGMQ